MKTFNLISFAIGLLAGGLIVAAWFLGAPTFPSTLPETLATSTITAQTTTPVASTSGAVAVSDQLPGQSVLIDSVTVPPPGVWIAVRDTVGGDDELGNVLGAVRVRGPLSAISIPLLRATESGHLYAVELYRGDGTGAFDPAVDSVYVDFDTGARVVALFKAL